MNALLLTDTQAREIRAAAEEAGRIMLRELRNPNLEIFTKADGSSVTSADYAADRNLKQELARITPGIPILSEEDDPATQRAAMKTGTYWAVDPLDGTSNAIRFAQGDAHSRYFGPLIGLVQDGVPTYGVAHYPLMDGQAMGAANEQAGLTYFTSADGKQAFRSEAGHVPVPLVMDKQPKLGGALAVGVGPRDAAFPESRLGGRLVDPQCHEGSRILHVAESKVALGYVPCHPGRLPGYWDLAAHDAILRAAGGFLVTMRPDILDQPHGSGFKDSRPLRYDPPPEGQEPFHGPVLAGSPEMLRQVGVPVSRFHGVWRDAQYR